MESGNTIIKTEGLVKRYGSMTAVDHLNLEITEGEVFGLLGPNGAGKTTTILMLLGLTEPNAGKATISNFDCTRNSIEVKRIVGYMPDNMGFYGDLTGRENLRFTADLNGIPVRVTEERIDSLLERVGLSDAGNKKVGTYSRGMKQRLGIADVLMKDPKVVILDEPTLGIDPEGIRELIALIRELAAVDGRTVLVSSHQLYQVQQICDRVGIFVKGKLIAYGKIDDLGKQIRKSDQIVMEFGASPDDDKLEELVRTMEDVKSVKKGKNYLVITALRDIRGDLVRLAVQKGFNVEHLRVRGGDLDDIYNRYFSKEGVV